MNIARLFDQKENNKITKYYQKAEVSLTHDVNEPTDTMGFLGRPKWYRKEQKLTPMDGDDFINILIKDPTKLKSMFLFVRQIDKDNTGFITRNEFDDILKTVYKQLESKELYPFMNEFASISNPLLINFRKFKEQIIKIKLDRQKNQEVIKDKLNN